LNKEGASYGLGIILRIDMAQENKALGNEETTLEKG
jgi:hypothetical protein